MPRRRAVAHRRLEPRDDGRVAQQAALQGLGQLDDGPARRRLGAHPAQLLLAPEPQGAGGHREPAAQGDPDQADDLGGAASAVYCRS